MCLSVGPFGWAFRLGLLTSVCRLSCGSSAAHGGGGLAQGLGKTGMFRSRQARDFRWSLIVQLTRNWPQAHVPAAVAHPTVRP